MAAAVAAPQGALDSQAGRHDALDANLRVGGAQGPSPRQEDYAARNLLVTGNAVGGRGFRGTVGYTAAEDFRGATGGDDTFAFRRDSDLSNPISILASQSRDSYALAGGTGLAMLRNGGSMTDSALRGSPALLQLNDSRIRLDRAAVASTASERTSRESDMRTLSFASASDGKVYRTVAGQLRGIALVRTDDLIELFGVGLAESARLREDVRQGGAARGRLEFVFADPFGTKLPGALSPDRIAPDAGAESAAGRAYAREYAALVDRVRSAYDIRTEQARQRAQAAPTPEEIGKPEPPVEEWMAALRESMASGQPAERPAGLSNEDLVTILRHGQSLTAYDAESVARADDLMRMGAEKLKAGRPFEAEHYFSLAAGIARGDPMPVLGVANSQVSAGLPLAAGYTLVDLFTKHPEIIDLRVDPAARGPERYFAECADEALRMGEIRGRDKGYFGIVAAYVGVQLGDSALVAKGLDLMATDQTVANLAGVLRAVWLPSPAVQPGP